MKNQNNKLSLLFVSAHPDDDALIAGTMKKFSNSGLPIYEFCCANAGTGKPNTNETSVEEQVKNREKEIEVFCNLIGSNKPYIFKSNEKNFFPKQDIVYALVSYMRKVRPKVIIVLNKDDYHFEHRLTQDIGVLAFEIATRGCEEQLGPKLEGSIILETDGLNILTQPEIFFDISDVFEDKMNAIKAAYQERLGANLIQFTEGLSKMRGGRVKVKHAECYKQLLPSSFRFTKESAEILYEFIKLGSKN